ncbi:MAG: S1 family peptidase [Bacillota bacterium]
MQEDKEKKALEEEKSPTENDSERVEEKKGDDPEKSSKEDNKDELIKAKEQVNLFKLKYKTYMIIAIIVLFTVNVVGGVFAYLFMENRYENALQSTSDELINEMEENFLSDFRDSITYDVLKDYSREYYLPDNYTSTGLYVNQLARTSVVEIICGNQSPSVRATGVIFNDEGYALTNAHVVTYSSTHQSGDIGSPSETIVYHEYDMVKAILHGSSEEYEMEIISYDTSLDLAIVKFNQTPQNIEPVTLTLTDYTNIGEEAVVIGNALGLGISITTGVVMSNYNYQGVRMLQTDTLAWEGNSGSGVFNINAEVLGIMSFEFTDSSEKVGVSYSIATEEIIEYIEYINNELNLNIEYTLSDNLPENL